VDGDGTPDTKDNSDADGMVDFDERERFKTSPTNPDTDNDCVADKNDVRGYVFDLTGRYSKRKGDLSGADALRKELDPDNDNGGRIDGDEDANRNGHTCDKLGRCDRPCALLVPHPHAHTTADRHSAPSHRHCRANRHWPADGDVGADRHRHRDCHCDDHGDRHCHHNRHPQPDGHANAEAELGLGLLRDLRGLH